MGWVILVVLVVIVSLLQNIIPIIIIAAIVGAIYAVIKGIAKAIQDNRDSRIAEMTAEVNTLISQYTPSTVTSCRPPITYQVDASLINTDIVESVRRYKEGLSDLIAECSDIDQKIASILKCHGCMTPKEKLMALRGKRDELSQMKAKSDNYHQLIESRKLQLLNEDWDVLSCIKNAANALLASKKCSASINPVEFVSNYKPSDLRIFQYKSEPTIFFLRDFYYCMFTNAILVFDRNGVFSTALDPLGLKINVERRKAQYRYHNNVDTDSKSITYTETRYSWLYTCKDGSPDLRYKGNRRIEYPIEVSGFEYGIITLTLGRVTEEFMVSSSRSLDLFEEVASVYCRECKHNHNPIPILLKLISLTADSKNVIESMTEQYLAIAQANNYFCKEITM